MARSISRLTGGMRAPTVYKEDFELIPGKAITLREGDDIALIATGSMVHVALTCAAQLAERGIAATVIDMHTIKPLDEAAISAQLGKKLLVTLEEHSVIGGLGEAVCSLLSEKAPTPVRRIGVQDKFGHSGPAWEVLRDYGLTADAIADAVRSFVKEDQ